jgi:type VI secretion system secreted protein VgrG
MHALSRDAGNADFIGSGIFLDRCYDASVPIGLSTSSMAPRRKGSLMNDVNDSTMGSRTQRIDGNDSLSVSDDQAIHIGGQQAVMVVEDQRITVGTKLLIEAADEIKLVVGQASLVMKKDGTIEISGGNITLKGSGKINVKASGEVKIKGSKVLDN